MSSTAWIILVGYAVFALIGTAVVLYIFRSTRAGFRAEPAEEKEIAQRETAWGLLVGLFMLTLRALTIVPIPYFFNTSSSCAAPALNPSWSPTSIAIPRYRRRFPMY